jgi:regulator of replication initiation timing
MARLTMDYLARQILEQAMRDAPDAHSSHAMLIDENARLRKVNDRLREGLRLIVAADAEDASEWTRQLARETLEAH